MSAVQRLCASLASRLRFGTHTQAALQTAARHLATRADDGGSSSSDDEQALDMSSYEAAGSVVHDYDDEEGEQPEFDASADTEVEGQRAYETQGSEADAAFLMTDQLKQLWEDVQRADPAAMLEQIEQDLQDTETEPPGLPPDAEALPGEEATNDDYRLLLEAIRLYFTAAPVEDEELDGMNEEDREMLRMIGGMLQDELEGPDTQVINMAPPGQLPWEILEVDEEAGVVHWGVDFTEGRAKDPWRNALLSSEAKQHMYELSKEDPEEFTVERLAEIFRIRQQRVMAILALKRMEEEARNAGRKLDDELQEIMDEEVYGCDEAVGSGERHYTILPSYPNYKELEPRDVLNRLEAKLGKPASEISEEDLTPELAREVLGVQSKEQLEEELAEREEAQMVEQFKRNLEYNMKQVGGSIKRASRKTHAPRRPKEGWSLVVTPLGRDPNPWQQAKQAYVAEPDGSRRPLTEDELLYLQRQAAIPRRRVQ